MLFKSVVLQIFLSDRARHWSHHNFDVQRLRGDFAKQCVFDILFIIKLFYYQNFTHYEPWKRWHTLELNLMNFIKWYTNYWFSWFMSGWWLINKRKKSTQIEMPSIEMPNYACSQIRDLSLNTSPIQDNSSQNKYRVFHLPVG